MSAPLDLTQLRTLVAIADCGGFGRAAAALHLSQPTVSQHVRALERRIDAPIVEKEGRRARFTPAGDLLLSEARRILTVHDEALGRLSAVDARPLVVGSAETTAGPVLPQLLGTLSSAFPGREVQFRIDRSTRLEEQLQRGELDLAVLLGIGAAAVGTEVGRLHLDWYSAPGWQQTIDAVPLVAYVEPCGMRKLAVERLGATGATVQVVAESPTLDGVIAAARAGLGVAVLPTSEQAPAGLVRLTSLPDLGGATVRLVSRQGLHVDVEQLAVDVLRTFFGSAVVGSAVVGGTGPIGSADGNPSPITVGRAGAVAVA